MAVSPQDNRDPPLLGYRERTRAFLRHLIFERQFNPLHPVVVGYSHHLELTTAHAEYLRALELSPPDLDPQTLKTDCYRGADLNFRYCDKAATSLYQDEEEENHVWENKKQDREKKEAKEEKRESWGTNGTHEN